MAHVAGTVCAWVVSVTHRLGGSTPSISSLPQLERWIWSAQTLLCSSMRSCGDKAKGGQKQVRANQRWELWKSARAQSRKGPAWKEMCNEWLFRLWSFGLPVLQTSGASLALQQHHFSSLMCAELKQHPHPSAPCAPEAGLLLGWALPLRNAAD